MTFHSFSNFEEFMDFIRDVGGADDEEGMSLHAALVPKPDPERVLDGKAYGIRWQCHLHQDGYPHHEVFVEMPERLHPSSGRKLAKALRRFKPMGVHTCDQGPAAEWECDTVLHVMIPQSEPGEELATRVALVLHEGRMGTFRARMVQFRIWLANLIAPAGMVVEISDDK